jgi:hypothetical protein
VAALFDRRVETDAAEARATTGAILLAEALHELRNVRRLLTPKD